MEQNPPLASSPEARGREGGRQYGWMPLGLLLPSIPRRERNASPTAGARHLLVDGHGNVLHEADLQLRDIGLLSVHHLHRPVAHGFLLQRHGQ